MKKIAKKIAHHSIVGAKKIATANPRVKNSLKRALLPHISSVRTSSIGYNKFILKNFSDPGYLAQMQRTLKSLTYRPLISVVVPTYNTDHNFLRDCLDSVLAQSYDNWELVIVDDASPDSDVRAIIKEYASRDSRISYKFLPENLHIANATNQAAAISKGEFIALFDHDDLLWPHALYEVVKALNEDKKLDFLYTDEDKITEDTYEHLGPFFKPDYNPDFLYSVNYITHFSVIRKSLYEKIGGERPEYNGAQDWDLFLRVFRATNKIHHIPKVVYSWRIHDDSTAKSTDAKPYVIEAQRKALQDDLKARGRDTAIVERDSKHPGYWKVTQPPKGNPLVSIVIPSKNMYVVLKRCIESIYAKSAYENFEIILVDTGSDDQRVLSWYQQVQRQHDNFKLVNWPEQPFSYARSCNEGARVAEGEVLIMLNNDTEVITPDWIEQLTGDAQRDEIGAVGPLLFFPGREGYIQHAGVGVGLGGVAANSFSMMTLDQPMSQTQHLMLNTKHNMTVVTGACLAIRKSVFESIGGFDEEFRITYNDVDLCLKLYEKGYQNLYTPHVRLVHHESISLGTPEEAAKRDTEEFKRAVSQFKSRWQKYIDHDPNLNPNLNKENAYYDII